MAPQGKELAFHLSSGKSAVLALSAEGAGAITESSRKELLSAVRSGQQVDLHLRAQVFFQAKGLMNRNFVRFRQGMLRGFAGSFEGAPFLRDHAQWNSLAVGGRILSSALERDVEADTSAIVQEVKLSAPWAVELALTGLMDKFSIGWRPTGPVHCSLCDADWSQCDHWPGKPDDRGRIAEAVFQEADGIETSAVPIPAVPETGIEDVRAALTLARSTRGPAPRRGHDMKAILKALGLADDASEADAAARLAALTSQLDLERAAHEQTKTALGSAQTQLAAAAERELAVRIDALISDAVKAGKLPPIVAGQPPSKLVAAIRTTAIKLGYDVAAEYVADLPRITPAGAPSVLAETTAPPRAAAEFTPELESVMRQMGLTREQVVKANPDFFPAAQAR